VNYNRRIQRVLEVWSRTKSGRERKERGRKKINTCRGERRTKIYMKSEIIIK
jgi:hypothetical protein